MCMKPDMCGWIDPMISDHAFKPSRNAFNAWSLREMHRRAAENKKRFYAF